MRQATVLQRLPTLYAQHFHCFFILFLDPWPSSLLHHYYSPPPLLYSSHQYQSLLCKTMLPYSASSFFSCKGACGGCGGRKEWQVRKMILHIVTNGWWYRMRWNKKQCSASFDFQTLCEGMLLLYLYVFIYIKEYLYSLDFSLVEFFSFKLYLILQQILYINFLIFFIKKISCGSTRGSICSIKKLFWWLVTSTFSIHQLTAETILTRYQKAKD